jgi:hypothetical protein
LIKENTFSWEAWMVIDRCTRKEFGFVAAKRRRATTTSKTESAILRIMVLSGQRAVGWQLCDGTMATVKLENSTLLPGQLESGASAQS